MGDSESRADDARQERVDEDRERQQGGYRYRLNDHHKTHIYWCERVRDGWLPRCIDGCLDSMEPVTVIDYEECVDYAEQLILAKIVSQ